MNLKQLTLDYVTSLGDTAAEHFCKAPSTIKTWLKTQNFPIEVVQEAIEHDDMLAKIDGAIAPISHDPNQDIAFDRLQDHHNALELLNTRVVAIEEYLLAMQAPAPAPRPAPEPTVVTGRPADTSNIRPSFTPVRTVAPNGVAPTPQPSAPPPTLPDTYGANMATLLVPYDYRSRTRR